MISLASFVGGPWDGETREVHSRWDTLNLLDLGWPKMIVTEGGQRYVKGPIIRDGVRRYESDSKHAPAPRARG